MRRSVAGVLLSSLMVLSLAMPAAAQSESPPDWSAAVSAGGWWEDQITDIAVDPSSGDILVVGAFHYDMYLGPFYLTSVQHATAGNTSDIFVAKLSDRKSTRLNSSHALISYAVFCLKKKNKTNIKQKTTTTTQTSSDIPLLAYLDLIIFLLTV